MAQNKKVQRFGRVARVTHWVIAISFFTLLFTGLGLFSPKLNGLLALFGGFESSRIIHRYAAVVFILTPLVAFLMTPKAAIQYLKEIVKWDKDDWKYIKEFPKEFFGNNPVLPPQDRFNAGEKLNSIIVILGGLLQSVSGLFMWLGGPAELVKISYPIHALAFVITTTFLIGHLFMAMYHPNNRDALPGMMSGRVTEEFANHHHAKWYKRIVGD
jgi:formate dehydrogenase subunit gamma